MTRRARRRLPPWSWPGAVALVVATLTSLGWSVALVLTALPVTDPVTAGGANLLATVGGVLVGGVAGYLGAVAVGVNDPQDATPEQHAEQLRALGYDVTPPTADPGPRLNP